MKNHLRFPSLHILAILLCLTMLFPSPGHAFWGQDSLETAAIVTGITLGACLLIVLVAGTMIELKGDPDDVFSRLPIQPPLTLATVVYPPGGQGQGVPLSRDYPRAGGPATIALSISENNGGENKESIALLLAYSQSFTPDLVDTKIWVPSPVKPESRLTPCRAVFLK